MNFQSLIGAILVFLLFVGCEKQEGLNAPTKISINGNNKQVTTGVARASSERPNIILIMADDLGWGDTGYNGHPLIQTPNLDTMAVMGLVFNRFYAASPVCSPTRGSVLTGRHPYRYGVYYANVGHLPEQELTLGEILKEHGYHTGFFGKWHLGTFTRTEKDSNRGGRVEYDDDYSPPWLHGFDVVFSTESKVPTYDPMLKPKQGYQETWWDPVATSAGAEAYGTAYWVSNGRKETENLLGDDSRVIVDRVIPFIRDSVEAESPFFAVVWLHSPHLPVVASDTDRTDFEKLDKYAQHYYGSTKAMDREIGRIRQSLIELGTSQNTLLWVTSDNGPEQRHYYGDTPGSTGELRGAKRSLYEGGIRVPGVIEWPGYIKAGRTTNVAAVTSDILPTVLDILGIIPNFERPLDGISLIQVLLGNEMQRTVPIGFESAYQLALIDQRYKIIHQPGEIEKITNDSPLSELSVTEDTQTNHDDINTAGQNPDSTFQYELYDLEIDPNETTNLAEKYPEIVKAMSNTLQTWRDSVNRSLMGQDYQ